MILAVDPGLQHFGWAAFADWPGRAVTVQQTRALYLASGSFETNPKEGDEWTRYALLVTRLRAVLHALAAPETFTLVCEIPAIDGMYRRNRRLAYSREGFHPGMVKHVHRVTGALLGCWPPPIFTPMPASTTPKLRLHALTAAAWGTWPKRTNEHERDAIVLGWRYLTAPARSRR